MDGYMWDYSGMLVNVQAVLVYLELDVFNSWKKACSSVLTFGTGSHRTILLAFVLAAQKVLGYC